MRTSVEKGRRQGHARNTPARTQPWWRAIDPSLERDTRYRIVARRKPGLFRERRTRSGETRPTADIRLRPGAMYACRPVLENGPGTAELTGGADPDAQGLALEGHRLCGERRPCPIRPCL